MAERILATAAALMLVLGASPARAETIKVIAAFNLTGDAAALDVPCYQGAALAVEILNREGGILGRQLQLVPVDTESLPDAAAGKVEAALAAHPDAIAGIGYSYSTEALAAGRVFQAAKLPFISPGATDPSVPAEVGDYMFYAAYGDDAQAEAMAHFARGELGVKRAAVWIESGRIYTQTVGRDFHRSFEALGGSVVLEQADADRAEFDGLIAKVKAASPPPEAIYVASVPDSGELIARARSAGIDVPLLSGDGWDEDTIVDISRRDGLGGIYFTTHRFLGVDTTAMKDFIAAYSRKNGAPPPSAFAPLGFDTVNLLADAIRRAGSAEPAAVRRALAATTDFAGIVGTISYEPGVRVPKKDVAVIEIEDGAPSLRWVATPE